MQILRRRHRSESIESAERLVRDLQRLREHSNRRGDSDDDESDTSVERSVPSELFDESESEDFIGVCDLF